MAKRRIHIENLRISLPRGMTGLPHGMTGNAQTAAGGIGCEIIKSIADALGGKTGEMRIDNLSAAIKMSGNEADIRKRAAEEISAKVKTRLG